MALKAVNCPNCGANIELDDSREFGFCLYCGTKVIQDKIVVEHQGSVKIDNSDYVQKFLQNARRALKKEDWEETEKYYNLVEQNDPTNIEAIFYSSFAKAKGSLIDSNLFKRKADFKVLINCVSIIDDNFDPHKEELERPIIEQISNDIMSMICGDYVYNQKKNGFGSIIWTDKMGTITLFNELSKEFCVVLENVAKKINENEKRKRILYYTLAIKHAEWLLINGNISNPKELEAIIMTYHKWIHELDPSHEIPAKLYSSKKLLNNVKGCYVATAVYGSYDCPQVWTLRRYRDLKLAKSIPGRAFIKMYYAVSPTVVKWFGRKVWFNKMWRGKLDKMVEKLQAQGYEDSPYSD